MIYANIQTSRKDSLGLDEEERTRYFSNVNLSCVRY